VPSRFIDELPLQHVEVENGSDPHSQYGDSRIAQQVARDFSSSFDRAQSARQSPGWQRYQSNRDKNFGRAPKEIEGHAVRRPVKKKQSAYKVGDRIFHQKFGYGRITSADGSKLDVAFEKAGDKKVLDGFVERA